MKGGEDLGYSESKDKLLKFLEYGNVKEKGGSLQFSLFSYNGGPPKLQIVRSFLKKDETIGYGKAGRLSLEELKFLIENSDKFFEFKNDSNQNT